MLKGQKHGASSKQRSRDQPWLPIFALLVPMSRAFRSDVQYSPESQSTVGASRRIRHWLNHLSPAMFGGSPGVFGSSSTTPSAAASVSEADFSRHSPRESTSHASRQPYVLAEPPREDSPDQAVRVPPPADIQDFVGQLQVQMATHLGALEEICKWGTGPAPKPIMQIAASQQPPQQWDAISSQASPNGPRDRISMLDASRPTPPLVPEDLRPQTAGLQVSQVHGGTLVPHNETSGQGVRLLRQAPPSPDHRRQPTSASTAGGHSPAASFITTSTQR